MRRCLVPFAIRPHARDRSARAGRTLALACRRPRPQRQGDQRPGARPTRERACRHGVDALDQLAGGMSRPIDSKLARHLLGAGGRALEPHQQAGLELRLGARQLGCPGFSRSARFELRADDVDQLAHHLRPRLPRGCRTARYRPAPSSSNRSRSRGRGAPAPPGTAETTCPRRTAPKTPGRCKTPRARYDGPCERHDEMALLERLCRGARAPDIARRLEFAPRRRHSGRRIGPQRGARVRRGRRCRRPTRPCGWRRSWRVRNARRSPDRSCVTLCGVPRIGRPIGLLGKGCVLQQLVGDLVGAVAGGGDLLQDHLALALELSWRDSAGSAGCRPGCRARCRRRP